MTLCPVQSSGPGQPIPAQYSKNGLMRGLDFVTLVQFWNNKRKQVAIEAVNCGQMRHTELKQVVLLWFYFSKVQMIVHPMYFISHRCDAAHPGCYRDNLSTFDIFYQIHFFPVQKLLIDLLVLSLSIALPAWGSVRQTGSACKKYVSYLNLINLFIPVFHLVDCVESWGLPFSSNSIFLNIFINWFGCLLSVFPMSLLVFVFPVSCLPSVFNPGSGRLLQYYSYTHILMPGIGVYSFMKSFYFLSFHFQNP